MACCVRRRGKAAAAAPAEPQWHLFCITNVIAVAVFCVSMTYVLRFWLAHGRQHSAACYAFDANFTAAALGAVASLLYFIAFCGVAFISADVEDSGAAATVDAAGAGARETDADVVIVGAGTVGASMATVLARQGKRVTLIERDFEQHEKIIGELLQPGGVRALERMGLAHCAKGDDVEPVMVEGYVCITPGGAAGSDLVLTYPQHDPSNIREYFGLAMEAEQRGVAVAAGFTAQTPRATATVAVAAEGGDAYAAATAVACPVTGVDGQPRGRSFWNHRFVHQLRHAALAETRHAAVFQGTARRLVYAKDVLADPALLAARSAVASDACVPPLPPRFAGFDEREHPIAYSGARPAAPSSDSSSSSVYKAPASVLNAYRRLPPETVVGVEWTDEAGNQRVTTARLSVVADGLYSTFRGPLHTETKPEIVSYFCGLVLHHPPGQRFILPYPQRGHVIMADPNPVLLYQITPNQTRVLIDMPAGLFKEKNAQEGGLTAYFEAVVAPQLPECVRAAFLAANASQQPQCMGNRRLPAAPTQRAGAILLGDAWNVRHPLTGGGMTVGLKDVEMMCNGLKGLDLRSVPEPALAAVIATFQAARANHASTINILANALHKVFTKPQDDDGTRARLRAACIAYLSLGGANAAGPIGLLSGLTPKPAILVTHFFCVALHALATALLPFPTPARLRQGYDLLHVACMIIMPLLAAERVTPLASPLLLAAVDAVFPWRKSQLSE